MQLGGDLNMDGHVGKGMERSPDSKVPTSGKVNTKGNRKMSPNTVPIGIDQTMALGSSIAGLCTSSAMLATNVTIKMEIQVQSAITPKNGQRISLPIPIAAYVYATYTELCGEMRNK